MNKQIKQTATSKCGSFENRIEKTANVSNESCYVKDAEAKQLYIVLSQTGTMLSRILKLVTGAKYNHASVSLSSDLTQMYSFGRRHPYNPFWGGFVNESPYTGTFKRFRNTKAVVLAVEISDERYAEIRRTLHRMYLQKENYHYNYLGLFLATVDIQRKRKDCYYCSEFVKAILQRGKINGANQLETIAKPIHFMMLPHTVIYCGRLKEYSNTTEVWSNNVSIRNNTN